MITPEGLTYMLDSMKIIDELESSVIADMSRRIVKMGEVSETSAWQAEMLQQSGMLYDDILKRVSDASGILEDEIKSMFAEAQTEVFNYDPVLLRKAGIDEDGFRKFSPAMTRIWQAAVTKTCNEAVNLTKTMAVTTQSSFISACDLAAMQVSSGAFSYTQAIANAIKKVSDTGGIIQYPSGATSKVDAAVRRAVLTGVNQTAGQVMKLQAEELQYDLMEISAHSGARPEHSVWQGRIVSLSGNTEGGKYLTLDDIGYGDVRGFQGANCRHTWWIFIPGVSKRLHSDEELAELESRTVTFEGEEIPEWQAIEKQRYMERKIRGVRRELVGLNTALSETSGGELLQTLRTEFAARSVKHKNRVAELERFCAETGLKLDKSRIQVYNVVSETGRSLGGFGKSVSQKVVSANKKEALKYTKRLYNDDGTLYVTDNWTKRMHPHIGLKYEPYAVIQLREQKGDFVQLNRAIYDENGRLEKIIHGNNHNEKFKRDIGMKEHKHIFSYNDNKPNRSEGLPWDDVDRKENKDLL